MGKALAAGIAVVVVAVVGLGAWWLVERDDEASIRGTCGAATFELARDTDDGGLEVTFELQAAAPGETWQVDLLQGSTPVVTGERTTDEDAEIDLDAPVAESGGTEFTVEATGPDGTRCTATLA